ncbi:hypothetical protein KKF34_05635 [Myxococcota bacterium]|nr:hypothetical protein [Myxococcota bacterium]
MRYLLIFIMLFVYSCEKNTDCYALGKTKEDCESNPECRYRSIFSFMIYGEKKIASFYNILRGWDGKDSNFNLCLHKSKLYPPNPDGCEETDIPSCPVHKLYCLKLNELIVVAVGSKYAPSEDWIACEEIGGGLDKYNSPVCGNGVIEPGEQCDVEQCDVEQCDAEQCDTELGSMPGCKEHGEALGNGTWTSGFITCTACKWDYRYCQ